MSEIVLGELVKLGMNLELADVIDKVKWRKGMRMRVLLEIDVESPEEGVRLHGFEFRFRSPNGRIIKDSRWGK